jgi:SOS-response transcriptional repressor LexA
VIIDRSDREITPRGLFAVRLPDLESCTIKRLQPVPDKPYVLLLSDNPKYNPLPVDWHDHLIIGRVVWSMSNWVR